MSRLAVGLTRTQLVVAIAIAVVVVGAATAMLGASVDLAQSASFERTAAMRVDHVLATVGEDARRAAMGATAHLDGDAFADGDEGGGVDLGVPGSLGATPGPEDRIVFRLDGPALPEGRDLVRVHGEETTMLARGIASFTVRRKGPVLHVSVTACAGPADDRGCVTTGTLAVLTRNP